MFAAIITETCDQIIAKVSHMKKIIPMIAMTALFATTMVAANDVHAQTGNDMLNNKVSQYNLEAPKGTSEFHRISFTSINKGLV